MTRKKRKTLSQLSADPFLQTLEGRDPDQPMTIELAAGFLMQSVWTLAEWRDAGIRPPGWYGEGKGIRYSLGELRRFVREQLEKSAQKHTPQSAAAPLSDKTTAAEQVKQIAGAKAVDDFGFDDTPLRGGRPNVNQRNFGQFLSVGRSTDEWVFAMVPSRYPDVPPRPVDLIATLDMDLEDLLDAECVQLDLPTYSEHLAAHARALFAAERKARTPAFP
jgi:hypothetical protein